MSETICRPPAETLQVLEARVAMKESAHQQECVYAFLIIDDGVLQPAGMPYIDVAMASLGKLDCHHVSIFASICLEIS